MSEKVKETNGASIVQHRSIEPVQPARGRPAVLTSPFPMTLDGIANEFCFSDRRKELFGGLKRYVEAVRSLPSPPMIQLIGGSFLDNVDEPGDIDLANIVMHVDDAAMPLYFDKSFTLKYYGIDPITIVISDDIERTFISLLRISAFYSHRRSDDGARGYIFLV